MIENKVIILVVSSCCLKRHLISELVACGSQCNPLQRVGSLISYCCAFDCSVCSNLLCYV